jgi:hypothetical protein
MKTSQLNRSSDQLANLNRSNQSSKTATSLTNQVSHVIILPLLLAHASSPQIAVRAQMDGLTRLTICLWLMRLGGGQVDNVHPTLQTLALRILRFLMMIP